MIHTLRAAVAVAALVVLPQFASAGPIRWGYRAEAFDGTVLRERTGLTDLVWSDGFLPDPERFGMPFISDPVPNSYFRTDVWRSQAQVVLTDELSGQSDSFEMSVDFVREYTLASDGSWDVTHEGLNSGQWPEPMVLTLGGNTYRVRSPGGEFLVNVTPGPNAATPEPGTLVLAGLGLSALGLVRRLRRAT